MIRRSSRPLLLRLLLVVMAAMGLHASTADAAVGYRQKTCGTGSFMWGPGSFTLTKPAGVVAGDLLIATVRTTLAATVVNTTYADSNGWTALQNSGENGRTFYKVAGASEPADYDLISWDSATFPLGNIAGTIDAYSGVDTVDPLANAGAQTTGSGNPVSLPNVAVDRDGSMRHSVVASGAATTTTWSSGITESCDQTGSGMAITTAHEVVNTGTTPTRTAARASSTSYVAQTYVIQPAPPAPTVTAIAPSSGPAAGGTTVTITGTGFDAVSGATGVKFGTTNATSYTVNSSTSITATAPAGSGATSVRVANSGGTSPDTSADDYTYIPAPVVTAVSPTGGPDAGGTTVTITGTGFTSASAVKFATTDATTFTVNSATSITATAPAGTAGTVDVRVTTPGGTSAIATADRYTYYAPPTVTALSPSVGPTAGGTSVTITGTGFTGLSGAAAVRFGATNAASYTVNSATSITATAPAGSGTADVRVAAIGGTSPNTAADDFTYYAPPTVTTLSPSTGPAAGGTTVTITGTNFAGLSGASAVQFGGTNASTYTLVNATTITATAPAHAAGSADVRVTTPGGTSANTAADDYDYIAAPAITSITPTGGPTAGGTTVTITGTALTAATQVDFGAASAVTYTVVNSTTITATTPPRTPGTVDVRVTTLGGISPNTAADDYTYYGVPTITALSPSAGPTSGGTAVTITGMNFAGLSGASAVQFGGTNATSYTVNSATSITATAPAGSTGTVDVRVATPGGTSSNTAADDYTYVNLPTVTAITPSAGPTGGATTVTITGTNFTGTTAVKFGATDASGYTIVSSTTITATAPAGSAGTVDVRVTTAGGTSANTAADDYTYAAAPTVTAISPSSGPTAGGTAVTITGTNLTGATAVKFGATDASGYTVVSGTTITATAPPGSGTADVRVTTAGGTTPNSAADDFTYVPAPTVTAVAPSGGPLAGGTAVTITGTNFTGATAVKFDTTDATSYTVVSATTITATAPAHVAGNADVRITTPSGTSTNTSADDYAYVAVPTVTALAPSAGPIAGGTTVTITGTGFTGVSGAAAVQFGGTNATAYTVNSSTSITVTAPAHAAGNADVRVTGSGGTSANTAADDYLYVAAPTITTISPMSGPAPGGTSITITGTNLGSVTSVKFGGTDATGFTVVSGTSITATAPPGTGTVDVRVTSPGGTSPNTATDDFTYVPAPTVVSLAPTSGPAAGGTTVTITGTSFTGTTAVKFDTTDATSFTVVNGTTITAVAPAHAAGSADVRVTTASGTSANTAADDYTYLPAPTVTAVSPSSGPSAGATLVTITGTGFTGTTAVKFGTTDASGYTVVSSTTITATTPAHAGGSVDVRVSAPGGTSANTAADDYVFIDPAPVITALSPSAGLPVGGTTVVITGTGFTGATAVKFGTTDASGYTVVSPTTITATAPAHVSGTVDVRVTGPGGISANTAADDFTYIAPCSIGGMALSATDFAFVPFTLDGKDSVHTATATVGVSDMTGAGLGWKVEVGTQRFTNAAGNMLPADAAQITGTTATPVSGNCAVPTRTLSSYPVALPISPAKAKIYNADVGTGLGPVDVNLDVALSVPGNASAGTYHSTWTVDLSAAP